MAKLTKRLIDNTTAHDQEIIVWDHSLPGFDLRAKPTGLKTFIIQYRNDSGRSRRLSLGQSGKLTLDEARKEAIRLMGPGDARQGSGRGAAQDAQERDRRAAGRPLYEPALQGPLQTTHY